VGHRHVWEEKGTSKEKIDIRVCACGAVHLAFFGRVSLHLSLEEYVDFAIGVEKAAKILKASYQEAAFMSPTGSRLSH